MKVLIVNDDSISAPGIAVLAKIAAQFGEVTVAAPAEQCSAMSQKLTLRELIPVDEVTDFPAPVVKAWRIGGTPVDCVKVAVEYLMEETPDVVLSGINDGFNAGQDISHSGTAGAAFEAQRFGIPAVALSVARFKYLDAMEPHLLPILRELTAQRAEPGCVWNVNFPAIREDRPLQGILRDRKVCPVSMYTEEYVPVKNEDGKTWLECRGIPMTNDRIPEGTDAAAVRAGYISIGQVGSLSGVWEEEA
jgi:5'-nucleotidase